MRATVRVPRLAAAPRAPRSPGATRASLRGGVPDAGEERQRRQAAGEGEERQPVGHDHAEAHDAVPSAGCVTAIRTTNVRWIAAPPQVRDQARWVGSAPHARTSTGDGRGADSGARHPGVAAVARAADRTGARRAAVVALTSAS